jgi:hypothetical protein
MSEWISVDEKLPQHGDRVLIFSNYIQIKHYEKLGGEFIFYDGDTDFYCPVGQERNVTHWMPLPKEPE